MIPELEESTAINAPDVREADEVERMPELRELPREVGYMLLSAGVLGFILPGPGTPAIIAGGLVLWPDRFGKAEGWFKRRFPSLHRDGMKHIHRYLKDIEGRYPGTYRREPPSEASPRLELGADHWPSMSS